jgi:serine phosphatase RsbU (regulator of sigma subunit)
VAIAARYRAGAHDVEVGGDWWDVVSPTPGRLALGVGDVSGHGVPAAVVMGHARAAMRAATLAGLGPAAVLDLLDVQLADVLATHDGPWTAGPVFATAVQVVLDLPTGRATLANAGHPPPLLHIPGAGVTRWTGPLRPPLGLGRKPALQNSIDVPPGASLLLYTDGLVEDRTRDIDRGVDELAALLAETAHLEVETALDAMLAAMTAGRAGTTTPDDVVAVLLRRDGPPTPS